jgi:dipeptidase
LGLVILASGLLMLGRQKDKHSADQRLMMLAPMTVSAQDRVAVSVNTALDLPSESMRKVQRITNDATPLGVQPVFGLVGTSASADDAYLNNTGISQSIADHSAVLLASDSAECEDQAEREVSDLKPRYYSFCMASGGWAGL